MLKKSKERQDRCGNVIKLYNNEFYTAILDEDLGRIEDITKQYGSNFLIEVQEGAPGEVFWKVNATMQPFLNLLYLWESEDIKFKFEPHG